MLVHGFAEGLGSPILRVGGALEYQHRVNEQIAIFGKGYGAALRSNGQWQPDFGVGAGLRWDW